MEFLMGSVHSSTENVYFLNEIIMHISLIQTQQDEDNCRFHLVVLS